MFGIASETKKNLLSEIKLPETFESFWIDRLNATDHRYLKDLRINVQNVLKSQNINKKEAYLMALGVAINEKSVPAVLEAIESSAKAEGAEEKEIQEVAACVSLMNANNVFYRFRHFMDSETYNNMPAGIKMSIMMNPVLGKEYFELLSLAISAINGCEMCVTSHEASVRQHGASQARVFDAIRLAAIFKSFLTLL
ncbi:carboxymuconolactone decarboxylase family protein [Siphonobacter sp. SORGH_AS_0500]|uniref:carboxymuconolactone decarboxylase family protein n=1 Tax=Siphonobacter sp. SORGH_AS_0500 TaxID=1864824 RepID=UPI002855E3AB|nr:carboxymuconolactone decarboxylase family protein [Siphonobacter sp. SORGH_AS_0500]MDR6195385.1 alkyl hydroperoxide reductase subunit D [Siphonobacter sp. SORGH_AS_0500]